jgi:ring-1,2-phenylacetyl-CoA epoxidase subunit PaaC
MSLANSTQKGAPAGTPAASGSAGPSRAAVESGTAVAPSPRAQSPDDSLLRYLLRLGDTSLVLGQRLGEWVGHAPALEEDLGLANLALDLVGQARLLLTYAAEVEGRGRDEDALAFLRDAPQFMNLSLAEQPNGDFAHTIVRQFLLDAWQVELYEGLVSSADTRLAAIAAKALKESRYHYRFSSGWLIRLGDGTEESRRRAQSALNALWRFTDELFSADEVDERVAAAGIAPRLQEAQPRWSAHIDKALGEATLQRPAGVRYPWHGKRGVHTEHLSQMLTEMQHLQRTYPGAQW